jgi:hypothetical protein
MAPNIGSKKQSYTNALKTEKNIEKIIKNVRKHVEKNYEYVGNKFADEARAIHYGEKEEREIYGETSIEEAVDLIEEGVNVTPLPGIDPKIKN